MQRAYVHHQNLLFSHPAVVHTWIVSTSSMIEMPLNSPARANSGCDFLKGDSFVQLLPPTYKKVTAENRKKRALVVCQSGEGAAISVTSADTQGITAQLF